MTAPRIAAIGGGACIGLAFALIGFYIAGIPGELVGLLLTIPVTIAWGYWVAQR